ncbi:protein of unknown function [Burkholderia multivorans]
MSRTNRASCASVSPSRSARSRARSNGSPACKSRATAGALAAPFRVAHCVPPAPRDAGRLVQGRFVIAAR